MKIIGITQRVHFYKPYNEIWECLDVRLGKFIADLGFISTQISFENINKIDEILEICDGIILSGGNDIGAFEMRDKFEYELLDSAIKRNKKVLGICRGMQIIATHFGVKLTDSAHKIRDIYSLCGALNYKVRCFHKYCVDSAEILQKNGFKILATSRVKNSATSEVEAFCRENILAISWHPEREDNGVDSAMIGEFFKAGGKI